MTAKGEVERGSRKVVVSGFEGRGTNDGRRLHTTAAEQVARREGEKKGRAAKAAGGFDERMADGGARPFTAATKIKPRRGTTRGNGVGGDGVVVMAVATAGRHSTEMARLGEAERGRKELRKGDDELVRERKADDGTWHVQYRGW